MQNSFDKKEMSLSRAPPYTKEIVFNSLFFGLQRIN